MRRITNKDLKKIETLMQDAVALLEALKEKSSLEIDANSL